jgi:hypothetical protein
LIKINQRELRAKQTHAMQPVSLPAEHDVSTGGDCDHVIRILLGEHASLRAVLQSILLMLERGPGDAPERFFDVMRAMLFYIDEFPERLHHPKESNLLFPRWTGSRWPRPSRRARTCSPARARPTPSTTGSSHAS